MSGERDIIGLKIGVQRMTDKDKPKTGQVDRYVPHPNLQEALITLSIHFQEDAKRQLPHISPSDAKLMVARIMAGFAKNIAQSVEGSKGETVN